MNQDRSMDEQPPAQWALRLLTERVLTDDEGKPGAGFADDLIAQRLSGVQMEAALIEGVAVLAPKRRFGLGRKRRTVPLFATLAVLDAAGAIASIGVETEAAADGVLELAQELPGLQLWLRCRDMSVLRSHGVRYSGAIRIHQTEAADVDGGLEKHASRLRDNGIDGISLPRTDWTGGRVALLHRFDRTAHARGVEQPHQLSELGRMRIDSISTPYPARVTGVSATASRDD